MVHQSIAPANGSIRTSAPRARGPRPRLRSLILSARTGLDNASGGAASALFRRPRFLRGACLETPVDARPISTARLNLRPHRIDDVDAWHEIVSDPRVIRYLSWPMRDHAAARRHLLDRTRHTKLWQTDDFLALAVVRDGRLIGDVSLQVRSVSAEVRSVEVGWVLSPAHQGQGYATEAVGAILDLAFGAVGARMVTAVIDEANSRSLALAERLGFTEVDRRAGDHLMMITPSKRR